MVIETNGGRTGKFGVIFLLFIDEAQAAWDSQEHLYYRQDHLDDTTSDNLAKHMYQELPETDSCVFGTLLGMGTNRGQTRDWPPKKVWKINE
jgi:hypothetical protein